MAPPHVNCRGNHQTKDGPVMTLRTCIQTHIPYALIWDYGTVEVLLSGTHYNVDFQREYSDRASDVEVVHDRSGSVAWTKVWVLLPYQEGDSRAAVAQAFRVLNRLLEVYRVSTWEAHVDRIPEVEWPSATVFEIDEENRPLEPRYYQPLGGGLTLARNVQISEWAIRALRDNEPSPVVDMLLLNARRALVFEDYRLAVVEAETAFEVAIDQAVTNHYRSKQRSEADIRNILECGLSNLIKHHLPLPSGGIAFADTDQHAAWEQHVYKLRNRIVHDGVNVKDDAARHAVETVECAVTWLRDQFIPT